MTSKGFLVVLGLTAAIYGCFHVRSADWVYEDFTWRNGGAKRPHIDPSWAQFQMPSFPEMLRAIPSRHLTAWTFAWTPDTPQVAHGINLCVHLVNALILALLIRRLHGPGWAVGSVFALLPLASQAVAYASGRAELLSALSILLACWVCLVSKMRPYARWAALAGILVAGSMTKPTFVAIVLPLVLWMEWTHGSWRSLRWLWTVTAAVGVPVGGWLCWHILTRPQTIPSTVPLWRWMGVQTAAAWMLLATSVLPFHLSIDHAWWTIPTVMQITAIVMFLVVATLIGRESLNYAPSWVTLGLGWFWIAVLPRLVVRDTQGWIREHHIYVSLIGIAIMLGGWLGTKDGYELAEG